MQSKSFVFLQRRIRVYSIKAHTHTTHAVSGSAVNFLYRKNSREQKMSLYYIYLTLYIYVICIVYVRYICTQSCLAYTHQRKLNLAPRQKVSVEVAASTQQVIKRRSLLDVFIVCVSCVYVLCVNLYLSQSIRANLLFKYKNIKFFSTRICTSILDVAIIDCAKMYFYSHTRLAFIKCASPQCFIYVYI